MARLTPEEKDVNKTARKERDAAFRARRKAYDAAMQVAEDRVEASPVTAAKNDASTALDRKVNERNAADQAYRAQLAELEAIHKRQMAMFSLEIDDLKQVRDKAWKGCRALRGAAEAEVNAGYPDMVGVYFAGGWQRPEGV